MGRGWNNSRGADSLQTGDIVSGQLYRDEAVVGTCLCWRNIDEATDCLALRVSSLSATENIRFFYLAKTKTWL